MSRFSVVRQFKPTHYRRVRLAAVRAFELVYTHEKQIAAREKVLAGVSNQVADVPNYVAGLSRYVAGVPNYVAGVRNYLGGVPNDVAGVANYLAGLGPDSRFATPA